MTGQGTRDTGRENWEGEAPAEPKRQRMASSEWRMVRLMKWQRKGGGSVGACP